MYDLKRPPATAVTGRSLAHGHRTPTERAFLGADIKLGIVALKDLTDKQISLLVGSSLPYQRAAEKVATRPELRARVEAKELSMMTAAKKLRPQPAPKQPAPKQPAPKQPAPDLFSLFAAATPHERAICMSVHIGEMYALLDMATSPAVGPVLPAADDLFVAQHH